MTRYYMDISDADDELSRLLRIDEETHLRMTADVMKIQQEAVQVTHVITGSLRFSERTQFIDEEGKWEGKWTAGGESPGMKHNPVWYAQEEYNRGNDHADFVNVVENHLPDVPDRIVNGFMRNTLRTKE